MFRTHVVKDKATGELFVWLGNGARLYLGVGTDCMAMDMCLAKIRLADAREPKSCHTGRGTGQSIVVKHEFICFLMCTCINRTYLQVCLHPVIVRCCSQKLESPTMPSVRKSKCGRGCVGKGWGGVNLGTGQHLGAKFGSVLVSLAPQAGFLRCQ